MSDNFALTLSSSIVLRGIRNVQIVGVKTRTGILPAETALATTAFVAESGTQTSTDPTYTTGSGIPYALRKASAFRTLSDEFYNDLTDPGTFLQRSLSRDVALAFDLAALEGSGAGEIPRGRGGQEVCHMCLILLRTYGPPALRWKRKFCNTSISSAGRA